MNTINRERNENAINKGLNKLNTLEEFYVGSGILLTGATGFVGKAVLEKLIRMCPRIAAIFILLRPKTDETIEQRFKKLIDDPVRKYYSRFFQYLSLSEVKLIKFLFCNWAGTFSSSDLWWHQSKTPLDFEQSLSHERWFESAGFRSFARR